jgi:hypothetical protein
MIILCKPKGTLNPCGARTHACSADTHVVARTGVTALLMSRVNIPPKILDLQNEPSRPLLTYLFSISYEKELSTEPKEPKGPHPGRDFRLTGVEYHVVRDILT